MNQEFVVQEAEAGVRLDMFVMQKLEGRTRSFVKNLIEHEKITLNHKMVKAGTIIKTGDLVITELSQPKTIDLTPENIPLEIVYQDSDLLVINKQAGLVVHPGGGSYDGTLVNALLFHVNNLSGINGEIRPGIVHRLDKETSGLMLVAKNDHAHASLSKQIAEKTCIRKYLAICDGVMMFDTKTIETQIGRHSKDRKRMTVLKEGGRKAITHLKVLKRFARNTLAEFTLQTGRTHQIRVHCKHIGFPVTNDEMYGTLNKSVSAKGQLLHSYHLGFTHPTTKEWLEFESNPPSEFVSFLQKCEKQS